MGDVHHLTGLDAEITPHGVTLRERYSGAMDRDDLRALASQLIELADRPMDRVVVDNGSRRAQVGPDAPGYVCLEIMRGSAAHGIISIPVQDAVTFFRRALAYAVHVASVA